MYVGLERRESVLVDREVWRLQAPDGHGPFRSAYRPMKIPLSSNFVPEPKKDGLPLSPEWVFAVPAKRLLNYWFSEHLGELKACGFAPYKAVVPLCRLGISGLQVAVPAEYLNLFIKDESLKGW